MGGGSRKKRKFNCMKWQNSYCHHWQKCIPLHVKILTGVVKMWLWNVVHCGLCSSMYPAIYIAGTSTGRCAWTKCTHFRNALWTKCNIYGNFYLMFLNIWMCCSWHEKIDFIAIYTWCHKLWSPFTLYRVSSSHCIYHCINKATYMANDVI